MAQLTSPTSWRAAPRPVIRAAFVGGLFGACLTAAAILAVAVVISRSDVSPTAPAVATQNVQSALQEHLAREYAAMRAPTVSAVQAALQQHLAREYGMSGAAASAVVTPWQGLQDHLAREYRSAVTVATDVDTRVALYEHVLRENAR